MSKPNFVPDHALTTYLSLYIGDPVHREGVLIKRNFCILQIPQKAQLTLQQEQQTLPNFPSPCGTSHPVYVVPWIVWGVVLDDPIDTRDIEPTSSNVGTEQYARFCIDELEKRVGTFLLLLLALYRQSVNWKLTVCVRRSAREGREPVHRCSSAVPRDISRNYSWRRRR